MKSALSRRQVVAGAVSAMAASSSVWAQPASSSRVLRIVVPYAAGGPIDITVRALAERLKDSLGAVVVDNRPGGGGNIGVDIVAKAPADGYTIGVAAVATHAINPWLYNKMPFDAERDFAPITQMVRVPNVLVMNADAAKRLGVNTLADLIRYAKANPGKLNYGSGGNGSAGHLAGEMFKRDAGVFAVHIPYNGGNPAQLALLSNQVDFNFDNLATASANIKAGRIKALGVTTATRSPAMSDVPTMGETLKGFEIDTWWGLVAPRNTPKERIDALSAAFAVALNSPETKSRFGQLLAEPVASSPQAFGELMRKERLRYESVVKASGAKVD